MSEEKRLVEREATDTFSVLSGLVAKASCKPGWSFRLANEDGALRLVIAVQGVDSYHPQNPLRVAHVFPVPTATYNEKTWRRWIFERCRGVENHELGEWFKIGDERPFAPLHGPGEDPYSVHEFRDDVDRRTLQDGTVVEQLGGKAMMTDSMHPQEITCPKCDGKKSVLKGDAPAYAPEAVIVETTRFVTCPLCNGTGTIDPAKLTEDLSVLRK